MIASQKKAFVHENEKAIIRPLLYFDIFNYPVTIDEIIRFAPIPISSSFQQTIDNLIFQKRIFQNGQFYSLQENSFLGERRKKGNLLAEKKMHAARKYAYVISLFPFVRAVMLSGSISKRYMDEKSDIDYFIITEKNRLWIARTMLVLFRRIFLFNSHKNFCTNYFVDRDNLEIKEKNFFTAMELNTLVPMFDQSISEDFIKANNWTRDFLPNAKRVKTKLKTRKSLIKPFFEKIISSIAPDKINQWLMKNTMVYWKKKYGKEMNPADFEIAFRTTEGISKSHPQFFQKKVLNLFDQKINRYEVEHCVDLSI